VPYNETISPTIPDSLYAETQRAAVLAELHSKYPLHEYARKAVGILNTASELGFTALRTQLIINPLNPDMTVPFPSFIGEEHGGKVLNLHLPPAEDIALRTYAGRSHIAPTERVRRALRFTNFVIEQTGTIGAVDFMHDRKHLRICAHTYEGRTAFADQFDDRLLHASYVSQRKNIIESALRLKNRPTKR
jgi:hypothetical protein